MANAVNMIIADGQATPVNMTLVPISKDNAGVYWFADIAEPNPLFRRTASLSLKAPTRAQKERKFRATIRVYDPTPDITSPTTGTGVQPAPSKAYELVSESTYWIPERSTLAERKDARAFGRNIQNHPQVIDLLENLVMCT